MPDTPGRRGEDKLTQRCLGYGGRWLPEDEAPEHGLQTPAEYSRQESRFVSAAGPRTGTDGLANETAAIGRPRITRGYAVTPLASFTSA